jgi:hypothetical protein
MLSTLDVWRVPQLSVMSRLLIAGGGATSKRVVMKCVEGDHARMAGCPEVINVRFIPRVSGI